MNGKINPKMGFNEDLSQRVREASPLPPNCASVGVAEYASVSLNMSKYCWKCLNKLFWRCQCSEYGTIVYARFTQSSEYVWLWLHTPQQCLNMPQYALMSLSVPEHGWILLNVFECAWKYLNKLFLLCQCSQYIAI